MLLAPERTPLLKVMVVDGVMGRGERGPVASPQRNPLATRDPLLLWRSISAIALILNLILRYLLWPS
jgi:hypothetical protein